jgi:hypothetical protein
VSRAQLSGTGLLADDLYLIVHNDRTGRPLLAPRAAGLGLAGALLAELVLRGSISVGPAGITVVDGSAPGEELARRVLRALLAEGEQLAVRVWLLFLAGTAAQDVAGRLARAGYLVPVRSRRPWHAARWVPADPDCAFAPVTRVQAALRAPGRATAGVTLAGLATACGLGSHLAQYLPGNTAEHLRAAVEQLDPRLREVIIQTRAAVDSAVLAHRV